MFLKPKLNETGKILGIDYVGHRKDVYEWFAEKMDWRQLISDHLIFSNLISVFSPLNPDT